MNWTVSYSRGEKIELNLYLILHPQPLKDKTRHPSEENPEGYLYDLEYHLLIKTPEVQSRLIK